MERARAREGSEREERLFRVRRIRRELQEIYSNQDTLRRDCELRAREDISQVRRRNTFEFVRMGEWADGRGEGERRAGEGGRNPFSGRRSKTNSSP